MEAWCAEEARQRLPERARPLRAELGVSPGRPKPPRKRLRPAHRAWLRWLAGAPSAPSSPDAADRRARRARLRGNEQCDRRGAEAAQAPVPRSSWHARSRALAQPRHGAPRPREPSAGRVSAAPRRLLRRLRLAPATKLAATPSPCAEYRRLRSTARHGQDAVPARPGLAHPSPRAQLPRACGDPLRDLDALGREHG